MRGAPLALGVPALESFSGGSATKLRHGLAHDSEPGLPARRTFWSWLPRMLLESLLIVFSVLFALGMDQWRTQRGRARQANLALQSIQAELEENLTSMQRARSHHLAMRDSLQHYVALRQAPPEQLYLGGIFRPAPIHAIAWESARESGTIADLPYALILELARVYDRQARYRALADALGQDIMMQVRREGMEPVLRDRASSFIGLQVDFANREFVLIEEYTRVLARLNSR
jgi:hypothetical protein